MGIPGTRGLLCPVGTVMAGSLQDWTLECAVLIRYLTWSSHQGLPQPHSEAEGFLRE